jgi:hypothetical protein
MEDFHTAPLAKPKSNPPLNIALAICFGGLFFMFVGVACAAVIFAGGGKALGSNLNYLLAVAAYLGLIVVALIGAAFSMQLPDWKHPLPVRVVRKEAVVTPIERNLGREFVGRALIFDRRVRGFVVRSASSAWVRLNEASPLSLMPEKTTKLVQQPIVAARSRRKNSR